MARADSAGRTPADTGFHRPEGGSRIPDRSSAASAPATRVLQRESRQLANGADVALSLDWVDLQGTLKQAWGDAQVSAKVLQVSLDHILHNAASLNHQDLPPCDLYAAAESGSEVRALLAALGAGAAGAPARAPGARVQVADDGAGDITMAALADTLHDCLGGRDTCLIRLPLGWSGDQWHFRNLLEYRGYDGGAGVGSGPGMAVGATMALKDSDRLPVAIIGDGDFLMSNTVLCVPMLKIVANNQSFFNDDGTRSGWCGTASVRSRTVGSASASATRRSTWRLWRARRFADSAS